MRAPLDSRVPRGLRRSPSSLRALCAAGRRALAASLLGILPLAATSCGGGDSDPSSKGDTVNVLELMDEAETLIAEARSAGMQKLAAEDFERIEKQIEKGSDLIDKGDRDAARKQLRLATNRLKSYIAGREKVKTAVAAMAPIRKEAEAAKKKADASKAKTSAATEYEEAARALAEATKTLEGASTDREVADAQRLFEEAKTNFTRAVEIAKENETYRQRAAAEKEAMAGWKKKAEERGAEEKAMQEWVLAAQKERAADDLFQRGDFPRAVDAYMETARLFTNAIDSVQAKEDQEKMLADAAAQEKAFLEAAQGAEAGEAEGTEGLEGTGEGDALSLDPTPAGPPGADVAMPPGPDTAPPMPSSIPLFDGYAPADYPQEVSAEDEALLATGYKGLVPSGMIEYDPATGAVRLDYEVGEDCRKDHIKLTPNTIIEFKSAFQPTPMRGMEAKERRQQTPFSFAGNTQGFIYFPVPFKYHVRVEFDMQVLTMDANGTFTVAPMMDPRKRNGYALQWLSLGFLQAGVPKVATPKIPPYNKVADSWFDKTRAVPMLVEYRMPDPDKAGDATASGRISITYDVGGVDVANGVSTTRYTDGVVGFHWSRTKFEVKSLTITGILDKKAAVALLKAKAGGKR